MAEITKRRQGELVRGVFEVLKDSVDGMPVSPLLQDVEKLVPPTPFEDATYPNHPRVRRYEKIIRFSTITAVKAGWLVKDKGTWSLTPEGRQAFESFPDPEGFAREATRLYRAWKAAQPAPDEEPDTEEEVSATSLEEAEEGAWDEIRRYVSSMPPYDFQDLVGALLKAMGYHVLWTAPPGPDRGIDLIAHNDPLGTTNPRIVVQVKRHAENKVTADGLRSFMAILGDRDVGIFIALAGFTSEAEREARSQERRRLTLLDLSRLVELWVEYFDRLSQEDRQRLPLKPVYFLAPD